jgi:N-methylhydantoinase B
MSTPATTLDSVTFEVVRSTLINLVSEMGIRLARVAFSPVITEGRDFSLAIVSPQGELIGCGPQDLPAHVGTLDLTVKTVLARYPADAMQPGDVFLVNDPHNGGTHNNDLRVVLPAFVDGELLTFLVACGHWADVGGPMPGSFNAMATSCFAEGVRIPPVKIYDRGVRNQPAIDLLMANLRLPSQATGDLQAQLQAVWDGEKRLQETVAKYGRETVEATMREMLDYSERLLRAELEDLQEGVYEFEDFCDVDKPDPEQRPIRVHLRLEIRDGRMVFDFRGSDPQPLGPSGSPLPMTWSATVAATLNLFPNVPYNHGMRRNMEVLTEPGSCVHVLFPTPCSGTAAGVYEKVVACVLDTIGQADPERRRVGQSYNLMNLTIGGADDEGRAWVMYLWLPGGHGATTRGDTTIPSMILFGAGTRGQPVEVLERFNPVLFDRFALKQDSMGPGRHRGGIGVDAAFHVTGGRATLGSIGDRFRYPPKGVDGGGDGVHQDIRIGLGTPEERSVTMNAYDESVRPGQVVLAWSGGGGGLGPPRERAPQAVLLDVQEGYLSVEAAERDYGVAVRVVDERLRAYEVDADATRRLRERR